MSPSGTLRPRTLPSPLLLGLAIITLLCGSAGPPALAQDARRPILNSRDFDSIQQAIDSLPPEGGTVVIPPGVHDVREKIRVPSHVELRGAGIDRTILVLADGVRDHLISNADLVAGNTNITIRDLQLRGNKAGQRRLRFDGRLLGGRADAWSFGIRFANVTDSLIENVEASDFTKDGFYLGYNRYNGTYRVRLANCRARDNGRNGISLTHGSFNVIEKCEVRDNNRIERVGGIQLEPDEGLEVSHNLIVGNRASGNHTGITLYTDRPSWRGRSTLVGNAVCFNTAEGNTFVGIWDHFGQGNYFVGNSASGSQQDFGPTESSRVGPDFAAACERPAPGR
jgi:parallel beta-helix repeat protein